MRRATASAIGMTLLAALCGATAHAQSPLPASRNNIALQLDFSLQVDRDEPVQGLLQLDRSGQTCVQVASPVQQRMWLDAKGAQVYYPQSRQLFRHRAGDRTMPAFLDALLAGLTEPAGHLPQGARLLSRTTTAQGVQSVWRVSDRDERTVQRLTIVETREGVASIVLQTEQGAPLREYQFGPRMRVGRTSAPTTITARYHGNSAKAVRVERWSLRAPKLLGKQPLNSTICLQIKGSVQESRW